MVYSCQLLKTSVEEVIDYNGQENPSIMVGDICRYSVNRCGVSKAATRWHCLTQIIDFYLTPLKPLIIVNIPAVN